MLDHTGLLNDVKIVFYVFDIHVYLVLRFYGEAVVKACVEHATSYVDISGEPQVHLLVLFVLLVSIPIVISFNAVS